MENISNTVVLYGWCSHDALNDFETLISGSVRMSDMKNALTESDSMGDVMDADKLESLGEILQASENVLKSKKSTKKSMVEASKKILTSIDELKVPKILEY